MYDHILYPLHVLCSAGNTNDSSVIMLYITCVYAYWVYDAR